MSDEDHKSSYIKSFIGLMVLLLLTIGGAYINLGPLNLLVAMTISFVKAGIIVLFFMHLRYSARITWLFAITGLAWLSIMLVLGMADYHSRPWIRPANAYIYPSEHLGR
jgi:cytochrome c oxidase subunit 4